MIVCPRPFTLEGRTQKRMTPGMSIADMLLEFDLNPETLPARVFIDDQLVEKAYWHVVKPKANHLVSVRVIPQGGDGGGKDILRIVAMVGILALAIFVPPAIGLAGPMALFAGAGIGIVGNLALSSLIPAPLPRRSIPLPIPQEHRRLAA
jgi:hypothetical protein